MLSTKRSSIDKNLKTHQWCVFNNITHYAYIIDNSNQLEWSWSRRHLTRSANLKEIVKHFLPILNAYCTYSYRARSYDMPVKILLHNFRIFLHFPFRIAKSLTFHIESSSIYYSTCRNQNIHCKITSL